MSSKNMSQVLANPVHLLDLFRTTLLYDDDNFDQGGGVGSKLLPKCNLVRGKVKKLLGCDDCGPLLRNVVELKEKGIQFKSANSSSMKAVSFTTQHLGITGILKLPALTLSNSSIRILWSVVAYDMCRNNYNNHCEVTLYLTFLNSLIDTDQDAKELRLANVLRNHLSSDQEVSTFFNSIGSSLMYDEEPYQVVQVALQRHYNRRCKSWLA